MADKNFPTGETLPYSANLKLLGDDGTKPGDVNAGIFARDADLKTVAKTGSYLDLTDLPTITGGGGGGAGILSGTAAPASNLGDNGAFYIRTGSSPSLYGPKASGAWPAPVPLVGPAGGTGAGILSGTDVPSSSVGNSGDFYIKTGAAPVVYGPKSGSVWPNAVSLVGPQGIPGTQGIQGVPGTNAVITDAQELQLPNGTQVATNSAGQFIGLTNSRIIPLGIDSGSPANGTVFKGPPMPWPYKVLGIRARVEGSNTPNVVVTAKIGSSDILGLVSRGYNTSTTARVDATGANTGAKESEISLTVTAVPSGTVTRAAFYVEVEQGAA